MPENGKTETAGDYLKKLSLLMDELPVDSSDEFSYDRAIHNLVEEARQIIIKLRHYFPDPNGTNIF